jgi:hypothetical protein
MTIGVPSLIIFFFALFFFNFVNLRLRKIMTLKMTSGRIVLIALDSVGLWHLFFSLREDDDRRTTTWDRRSDGQTDRNFYCGRRTIGVPQLGLDSVTNIFYCGRMTIGVPSLIIFFFALFFFNFVNLRLRKIMTLKLTSGRIVLIAG